MKGQNDNEDGALCVPSKTKSQNKTDKSAAWEGNEWIMTTRGCACAHTQKAS